MERCNPVVWPKNKTKPPQDRTYTRIEQTRVNPTVYATLCVAASMGIILGFAFLGINIKYRHQKWVLLCDDTTSFSVELSGMNLTLVNGFGWNFINANLNGSLNVIKMEIVVKQ